MVHEDNAVAHYHHLRQQGVHRDAALDHTAQRFGVSREILRARVDGFVADTAATHEALASARYWLTEPMTYDPDSAYALHEVLRDLYNAITGEDL
jgi:hypothetical protein